MIDTHTHLQFDAFEADLSDVMRRMLEAGVHQAIVVGVDLTTSEAAVMLAEQHDHLFAAVGIHPGDAALANLKNAADDLARAIDQTTVAIGEIGLDYKAFDGIEPDKQVQRTVFEMMITLANEHRLPAILHSRMAETDVIDFIRSHPLKHGGVVHCYTADYATAARALDLGLMVSFTAMITYPKNEALRQVLAKLPHDLVMIETDCPFLPPQSYRGQRNEPAYLDAVAETVGQVWGKPVEYVDEVTTRNAMRLFKLKA